MGGKEMDDKQERGEREKDVERSVEGESRECVREG